MKILHAALLLLVLSSSQAILANEAEITEDGPTQVIQSTIVKLNQLTTTASYSPQMMDFFVEQEIAPLFDFDYIANEVLFTIESLSENQVEFFSSILKKDIMATLLTKLVRANTTSFRFISARPVMGNRVMVKLRVNGVSRFGVYIDLLFHQNNDNKWQISDIILNNDSLINFYQKIVLIKVRRYGIHGMLVRI